MLDAILGWFSSIGDFMAWCCEWIKSSFNDYISFFKYVGIGVRYAYDIIGNLPLWLRAFALCTMSISIVYLILGRVSGKSKGE